MKINETERKALLDEGLRIFFDAADYNDDTIVAYMLLLKKSFKKFEFKTGDILISKIKEVINSLGIMQAQVLSMRFGLEGEGVQCFIDIGEKLSVSREAVRQHCNNALAKISRSLIKISLTSIGERRRKLLNVRSRNEKAINLIKQSEQVLKNTDIKALHLSTRSSRRLTEYGINNVYDFIFLSREKIDEIPGLGSKSISEIHHKQDALYKDSLKDLISLFSIDVLDISGKMRCSLKKGKIYTIGNLQSLTKSELYEILAPASVPKIIKACKEFLASVNVDE